ncbi:MAG: hypothetical protein J6M57_07745, partial [Acidaminococcaceae bacterium]|nr:hypothetical protein [Acidaminococcaceae bacterium]
MREHFGARRVTRRALVFGAPKAHWILGFKILQKPNPTGQIFFLTHIESFRPDKASTLSFLLRHIVLQAYLSLVLSLHQSVWIPQTFLLIR